MAAYISQKEAQYLWVDMKESLPVAFHCMREIFSIRKCSPILPPRMLLIRPPLMETFGRQTVTRDTKQGFSTLTRWGEWHPYGEEKTGDHYMFKFL